MAQIKIFGLRDSLNSKQKIISDTIHSCVCEALKLPIDKRAHRFFPLETEDFFMPDGRSNLYTILEINMIFGRTKETKKKLIRLLFEKFKSNLGIEPVDLEIQIIESEPCNWGFRGMHGDEIKLNYSVNI